jgi:UDP-N-acetyl-D-mannosaminuronic acid dehydrogenase
MTKVCVFGLGYIGLPTASILATNGFEVLGVDVRPSIVEVINRGQIHIREPGLMTIVQAATMSGRLRASLEPEPADIFIIAVPTPCIDREDGTKGAELTAVRAATKALCTVVKAGDLVILESTSPPGTTKDVVAATIEAETGLVAGRDVAVAHSPERVLPGHILRELIQNDRVIGGVTPGCAARAAALYSGFIEGQCLTTDSMTAEMVKLMENAYRDVNIALANELALIAERLGFDANEVIDFANRHPRVNLHRPGPGVGGHCISVDPWFVYEAAPEQAKMIRLARAINDGRPAQVCQRLEAELGELKGEPVAIFGVAYKGNVDDVRESPVTEIVERLRDGGASVRIYDPHVREYPYELNGLESSLEGAKAMVIGCAHDEFRYLDPDVVGERMAGRLVFDTVNILNQERWSEAGFVYRRVGRG